MIPDFFFVIFFNLFIYHAYMIVEIPYGKKKIAITITEPYELLVPNPVAVSDEEKIIKEALQNPVDQVSFEEFAKKSEKLLVIVNDATRPTPTSKILHFLHSDIVDHPDVVFLVATGVHRAPTDEEYRFIFGETYEDFKDRIFAHDARKKEDMTYLGKSKNGTEMYINSMVPDRRNILVIGSVEPHYFAGYTGGRKSFLPGVASYETIEMNHRLALEDKACSLALEGNPVHEDMVDAMKVLRNLNVFSIQTVLTSNHEIYAVTAGDLHKSFDAAIHFAHDVFCVPLKEKGNIVVTAAPYPMDIDLYQSQKALDNGKLALQNEGIIILVSKCRTGVGEDAFLELLRKADSPEGILDILGKQYKLGYHKAAKMAQIGIKAEMWAVTDLDAEIMKTAMLKPYSDIQVALDEAIKKIKAKGMTPRIIVMPFGSLTIPLLPEEK
jgi:nickel-dependent lactate racemase